MIFAFIAIGILISVHEFGHFLFAKLVGIKVLKFSIGFGPEIFSFTMGETRYAVSAFPFGGFVKLYGESPSEDVEEKDRSFSHRPPKDRAWVVFGGPFFNVFFAFLVFIVISIPGVPRLLPVIGGVEKGSPAWSSGIKPGDEVVEIDGVKIATWYDMSKVICASGGRPVNLKVRRDGKLLSFTVKPKLMAFKDLLFGEKKRWIIGVTALGKYKVEKLPFWKVPYEALRQTGYISYVTVLGIYRMITGAVSPKNIGGPIMIMKMAGEQASLGVTSFLYFLAVISINLGIINLFPIPILDGWHLLMLGVEGVRGRPISEERALLAQKIGITILIILMALAFYNDLVHIFFGKK